jgi:hypothetical protein
MAEHRVDDDLPHDWVELAARESGVTVPDTLSEEPPPGSEDHAAIDGVIDEAREASAP